MFPKLAKALTVTVVAAVTLLAGAAPKAAAADNDVDNSSPKAEYSSIIAASSIQDRSRPCMGSVRAQEFADQARLSILWQHDPVLRNPGHQRILAHQVRTWEPVRDPRRTSRPDVARPAARRSLLERLRPRFDEVEHGEPDLLPVPLPVPCRFGRPCRCKQILRTITSSSTGKVITAYASSSRC